jgi:hypothetical protein
MMFQNLAYDFETFLRDLDLNYRFAVMLHDSDRE